MLPDNPIRSSMEPGALGVFAGNQMRQMTDQDGNSYLHAEGAVASPQDMLSTITFPVRTGRLYVKFDVRGGFAAKDLSVLGTDRAGWYVAPAAGATPAADPGTWRTVRVDLTDSANVSTWDSGDTMRATWEWAGTGASGFDLDNVAVYWCSPVSRGEPGSFDGDGLADAKLVSPRGDLVFLRGEPKGTRPNSIWRGGTGWGGFTWIGASGDVNGDTHADLLGRTANGDFYVYYGDGVRSFTGGKRVGWGWGEMTSILPVGDVDGDGRQDLIARSKDGTMRLCSFTAAGGLAVGKVVGSGWQNFVHIVAIRSVVKDKALPTRLYAITPNGDMKSYTVTSSGAMTGWGAKIGNGWSFDKVVSVGDLDGDSLDDVVGVNSTTGLAYLYPTLGDGLWDTTVSLGSGWKGTRLVG